MGTKSWRMILAVIISLLLLGSGAWLIASGRPLNNGILAAHKLLAIAGLVFFGIAIYQMSRAAKLGMVNTIAVLITGLLFLATIVSGAFAIQSSALATAISAHRLTLTLTLISAIVTFLLIRRGK